jgi:hypothetical protein
VSVSGLWWSGREAWFMQGVAVADRELLDADSLVRHLVPAGSVFAFRADHRRVFVPGRPVR